MAVSGIDLGLRRRPRAPAIGLSLFALIVLGGLTWAKWDPYTRKLVTLWGSRSWSGHSLLGAARGPVTQPSWHAAWSYARAYGSSVWIALVAALVISAAIDALVSRRWLLRVLSGRGPLRGSVVGGLLALPCMMCTCCSAPIVATLRRRGVPTSSVLAYWVGNPVLNPAVLAFLALVAPWQWCATRAVVGGLLVFGGTALVARLAGRPPVAGEQATATDLVSGPDDEPDVLRSAPSRFFRALGRLAVVLIPEYAAVVLIVGAFHGWLFPLGSSAAHWGLLVVGVAAVAGTLVVLPTAGEIPVLLGLSAVGLTAGPLGALLITLPAVSLPSLVMVGRALSWRVTAVMTAAVAVAGLAGAGVLAALT